MAYVTKLNNGSQTLTIRDPEALHGGTGDTPFNPSANIDFTGIDTFSISPTVPTVTPASDSTTKAASTAFVQAAIAAAGSGSGGTVDHHYAIVEQVSATCTLTDRAVNILNLGAATSATITMPDGSTGKARDFWLVLYVTTSETKTYTLSGGTFYGEDDTTFEIEADQSKPNIFVFTEFAAGKFAVSRRLFSSVSSTIH